MPIYTRTGDTGTTAIFGGKRVLKCEELVDVYGSVDELNSWFGLLLSFIDNTKLQKMFTEVQNDLFIIGSTLAGWKGDDLKDLDKRVKDMEKWIDAMEKQVSPLSHFILPGGSQAGSFTHITRSICRRVERQVVAYKYQEKTVIAISEHAFESIIKYLNRLSDLLFMLARFINKQQGIPEVKWSGTKIAVKVK